MNQNTPTIGLEIHAILKTKTKMFCDSLNDLDEREPNKNVCPICAGHPGTLPVANREAVRFVIRAGVALGGTVALRAKFDRKNYFYPDLPKGYQISQYDEPLVSGGDLLGARIRRIHLEEDAGRLVHRPSGAGENSSFVDFNRAGAPLMELVTEPDFRSADDVLAFAKELQLVLRYLGVSDADMEKGQLRIEANVSLDMGTKVELKNINSFRAVRDAIEYEVGRQAGILSDGGAVTHETRGWDEGMRQTVLQRTKEEAHDYRYFPDPDLPPIDTRLFAVEEMKDNMPELPAAKRARFQKEFGLTEEQSLALVEDKDAAKFYEEAESELAQYGAEDREGNGDWVKAKQLLYNYLTSDLKGFIAESGAGFRELKISPENMAELVKLIVEGKILSRQAKDILEEMFENGGDPSEILEERGLHTVSDGALLEATVLEVLRNNPEAVLDYKRGKEASLQFLIGKAMQMLRGTASPQELKTRFLSKLTE